MKKASKVINSIILIICLCCTALFSGCANESNKSDESGGSVGQVNADAEDQDYQYEFEQTFSPKFYKTSDGYYFSSGSFIYYMDAKTMKYTPVCNKPDCLHDRQEDKDKKRECNAYVSGGEETYFQGIGCYNGYIYFEEVANTGGIEDWHYMISRLSCDGSKKDIVVNDEDVINIPYSFMVHRGYLYYSLNKYIITDQKDNNGNTIIDNDVGIYRINLNDNNLKPELFISKKEMSQHLGENSMPRPVAVRACGEYVIVDISGETSYNTPNGENYASFDEDITISKNINGGKTVNISEVCANKLNQKPSFYFFTDKDKLLFFGKDKANLYSVSPDGKEIKKVFEKEKEKKDTYDGFAIDDKYYYIYSHRTEKDEHGIDVNTGPNTLKIYTKDFKLLNTLTMNLKLTGEETIEKMWFEFIPFSKGDKIIVYDYLPNDNGTVSFLMGYISKPELLKNNGDLEVHTIFGG